MFNNLIAFVIPALAGIYVDSLFNSLHQIFSHWQLILLWGIICLMENLAPRDFFEKHKKPLLLFLLGLIFLGIGALSIKMLLFSGPQIEIDQGAVKSNSINAESPQENLLIIEAAGAVIKPGIYELPIGSRINDLLVLAGGLSGEADRDWLSKNINLAQKLSDGQKIYIPKNGEVGGVKIDAGNEVGSGKLEARININTATASELDTLWGVGEVTVQKIIAGRPFQKPEDLLYKKIVKSNVWEKIKDLVTVY